MSLETSRDIFLAIICLGLLAALYYVIKDRVEILNSIKPNSIAAFFGLDRVRTIFGLKTMILFTMLNTLGLIIWVPFWMLDRLFKLNIFEENNPK